MSPTSTSTDTSTSVFVARRKLPDDLGPHEFERIIGAVTELLTYATRMRKAHPFETFVARVQRVRYGSDFDYAVLVAGSIAGVLLVIVAAANKLMDTLKKSAEIDGVIEETSKRRAEAENIASNTAKTDAETELLRMEVGARQRALAADRDAAHNALVLAFQQAQRPGLAMQFFTAKSKPGRVSARRAKRWPSRSRRQADAAIDLVRALEILAAYDIDLTIEES